MIITKNNEVNKEGKKLRESLWFMCPGCKDAHRIIIWQDKNEIGPVWGWNGDLEKPTITPSILVNQSTPERRCHSFVRGGKIEFLGDCFHELAGKVVDIPELPDWLK